MSTFDYRTVAYPATGMEEIYRLRYKVYCLECGYEDVNDHKEGLEFDLFDSVSTHFLASEADSGKIVGTARIIHASEKGLPALNHCQLHKELLPDVPMSQVGEISRLAFSKEYRRSAVDKVIRNKKVISISDKRDIIELRKQFEDELVSGLYNCIYRESTELGLTHLFAVMADSLYTMLKQRGLEFKPVGPKLDYHGLRRPYIAAVEDNMHCFEEGAVAAFA